MDIVSSVFGEKSRLRALLQHFSAIEDPRQEWRVLYPLPEILRCPAGRLRHDRRLRRLWGDRRLG
jgi:hypothetical protein